MSTYRVAPSAVPQSSSTPWQEKLHDHCRARQMTPPVWTLVSDRRGGRTAWSSRVVVQGREIEARFWYDGDYVAQAKEDAAREALERLEQTLPRQQQRTSLSPALARAPQAERVGEASGSRRQQRRSQWK
ncbi:hypothetical protein B0A49_02541 [Cryomyces minteri]|uniref:DRBM domain-containing protein n=1 Tax=Cryomyces minteri TaxID=331657 RepID=A0A4U0Y1N2_9PEZI|nr:hypothetical protein B0A49_02541 [Cryomyces minteri]